MRGTPSAPVLVVGVHRAGTSAVTRALAQLGLHVGARCDENHESTFFQRLNRRLSAEAGGHWTTPVAVYDAIRAQPDLASFVDPLRAHLRGPGTVEYWGVGKRREPWGWKDPRNTYLLPIWGELYPGLRVVWVRRNPIECGLSLAARSRQVRAAIETSASSHRPRDVLWRLRAAWQGHPLLADGWRTLDERSACDIALTYAELQETTVRSGPFPWIAVDYHELTVAPREVLGRCAEFLGLEPSPGDLDAAAIGIEARPSRVPTAVDADSSERLRRLGWDVPTSALPDA